MGEPLEQLLQEPQERMRELELILKRHDDHQCTPLSDSAMDILRPRLDRIRSFCLPGVTPGDDDVRFHGAEPVIDGSVTPVDFIRDVIALGVDRDKGKIIGPPGFPRVGAVDDWRTWWGIAVGGELPDRASGRSTVVIPGDDLPVVGRPKGKGPGVIGGL